MLAALTTAGVLAAPISGCIPSTGNSTNTTISNTTTTTNNTTAVSVDIAVLRETAAAATIKIFQEIAGLHSYTVRYS